MAEGSIPLSEWSGSGATDRLRETIVELDKTAARQTKWLIGLTWALVAFTLVLVGLTVALLVKGG